MNWVPMQINGSIPMHVARAYGVKSAQPSKLPAAAAPAQPTARLQAGDAYAGAAEAQPNPKIDALVAGRVNQPINFAPAPAPQSESLQLYTRAADRIEAGTAVQLGQSLDVSG